ncbi:MAG: monofunctional biosynthetic peptidoglycan transglycosylase [Rhodobacteraceae bacterium]|nr:monofunctional biosynthetic peptidoglycan transglycosylase [Paracoccaceae bacterium]
MAQAKKKPAAKKKKTAAKPKKLPLWRRILRWAGRGLGAVAAFFVLLVFIFAFLRPPTTPYIIAEGLRHGGIDRQWVRMRDVAPVMGRSVVAAEDANFCLHWGFDIPAIRDALEDGAGRGASTLTQQTVKNVFLWQGRSWPRKAMEALLTPVVELVWTKRRIVEVYLNVAEFDTGVFGVQAAAQHYFGVDARDLTATQAARLAAVLPNPKERSASRPTTALQRRANAIADGAETIRRDGRADCFED